LNGEAGTSDPDDTPIYDRSQRMKPSAKDKTGTNNGNNGFSPAINGPPPSYRGSALSATAPPNATSRPTEPLQIGTPVAVTTATPPNTIVSASSSTVTNSTGMPIKEPTPLHALTGALPPPRLFGTAPATPTAVEVKLTLVPPAVAATVVQLAPVVASLLTSSGKPAADATSSLSTSSGVEGVTTEERDDDTVLVNLATNGGNVTMPMSHPLTGHGAPSENVSFFEFSSSNNVGSPFEFGAIVIHGDDGSNPMSPSVVIHGDMAAVLQKQQQPSSSTSSMTTDNGSGQRHHTLQVATGLDPYSDAKMAMNRTIDGQLQQSPPPTVAVSPLVPPSVGVERDPRRELAELDNRKIEETLQRTQREVGEQLTRERSKQAVPSPSTPLTTSTLPPSTPRSDDDRKLALARDAARIGLENEIKKQRNAALLDHGEAKALSVLKPKSAEAHRNAAQEHDKLAAAHEAALKALIASWQPPQQQLGSSGSMRAPSPASTTMTSHANNTVNLNSNSGSILAEGRSQLGVNVNMNVPDMKLSSTSPGSGSVLLTPSSTNVLSPRTLTKSTTPSSSSSTSTSGSSSGSSQPTKAIPTVTRPPWYWLIEGRTFPCITVDRNSKPIRATVHLWMETDPNDGLPLTLYYCPADQPKKKTSEACLRIREITVLMNPIYHTQGANADLAFVIRNAGPSNRGLCLEATSVKDSLDVVHALNALIIHSASQSTAHASNAKRMTDLHAAGETKERNRREALMIAAATASTSKLTNSGTPIGDSVSNPTTPMVPISPSTASNLAQHREIIKTAVGMSAAPMPTSVHSMMDPADKDLPRLLANAEAAALNQRTKEQSSSHSDANTTTTTTTNNNNNNNNNGSGGTMPVSSAVGWSHRSNEYVYFERLGSRSISTTSSKFYGSTGVIYRAGPIKPQSEGFSMKIINDPSSSRTIKERFETEMNLLHHTQRLPFHENIESIHHFFIDHAPPTIQTWDLPLPPSSLQSSSAVPLFAFVITDYHPFSLADVIAYRTHKRQSLGVRPSVADSTPLLSIDEMVMIICDISSALCHLHTNLIAHRDVRADTILFKLPAGTNKDEALNNLVAADARAVLTDFGECFDFKSASYFNMKLQLGPGT
jgi:hypothetical protein